jgi:hypothetical protein
LRIAELLEHIGPADVGERRIDAYQVVGLRARRQALFLARQRLRIGFGAANFLRDGVGIVGETDSGKIGRVRLRHFF